MLTPLSIPVPRSPADDTGPRAAPCPAPPAGVLALFIQATTCLHDAERASRPGERFASAYVAAQRAATAVVVARSHLRDSARPVSVWTLLIEVAPEFRDWSKLFAAGSDRRAAAEAGIPGVSLAEADRICRLAGEFLDVVGRSLPGVRR